MVGFLLTFYLSTCQPSHEFFDDEIYSLTCEGDPCCSEKQDLIEIFPTHEQDMIDQENEEVHDYNLHSAGYN